MCIRDRLSYSQNVPLRLTECMKDVRDVVEENHMYIRIASNDFFAVSKDVVSKMIAGEYTAQQAYRCLLYTSVVGRITWYKISYIYVSVKDLAELTSEGETFSGTLPDGPWNFGSSVLKQGSTGSEVEQVQFWLSTLAQYESRIPAVPLP